MKWILCLVIILKSASLFAQTYTIPRNDNECKKINTGSLALKIEKGNENIFQIGVKLTDSCEIIENSFFRLYWFVDKGSDSHCERLTSFEKKFFKFNYNQIKRLSSNKIRWNTDVATKIIKKSRRNGYEINPWLDIVSEKVGDECILKSYLTVNKKIMRLDEMKIKLRFLKVKSVSTFLEKEFLTKFF